MKITLMGEVRSVYKTKISAVSLVDFTPKEWKEIAGMKFSTEILNRQFSVEFQTELPVGVPIKATFEVMTQYDVDIATASRAGGVSDSETSPK